MSTLVCQQKTGLANLANRYVQWFVGQKIENENTSTDSSTGTRTCTGNSFQFLTQLPASQTSSDGSSAESGTQMGNDLLLEEHWIESKTGTFKISREGIKSFLEDLGSHCIKCMNEMKETDLNWLVEDLVRASLKLIEGITSIVAERDSSNNPSEDFIPPVLPYDLVKVRGREMAKIVDLHRNRLLVNWSPTQIQLIETQFQQLATLVARDEKLREQFAACGNTTTFKEAWELVGGRYDDLRDFCGGLSTAFPSTSTVESDFSLVKWEKDEYRTSLTDLSLEGILHTKQFEELEAMAV